MSKILIINNDVLEGLDYYDILASYIASDEELTRCAYIHNNKVKKIPCVFATKTNNYIKINYIINSEIKKAEELLKRAYPKTIIALDTKLYPIGRKFTYRDIPIQIGLTFQTLNDMINNQGEIENSKYTPEYKFEEPISNMEWALKDMN